MGETREYVIYVCALCGSDNIMSNEDDSHCYDCKQWMNVTELVVVPKTEPDTPEAINEDEVPA